MKRSPQKSDNRPCIYFVHTDEGYVAIFANRAQAREMDPNSVLICSENEVAEFPQIGNSQAQAFMEQRAEALGFLKIPGTAFFQRKEKKIGFVYFIEAVGVDRIKIGYSDNPEQRIKQLLTGSAVSLEMRATMPGSQTTEKELHQRFAHLRIENEWFNFTDEIRQYMAANCI